MANNIHALGKQSPRVDAVRPIRNKNLHRRMTLSTEQTEGEVSQVRLPISPTLMKSPSGIGRSSAVSPPSPQAGHELSREAPWLTRTTRLQSGSMKGVSNMRMILCLQASMLVLVSCLYLPAYSQVSYANMAYLGNEAWGTITCVAFDPSGRYLLLGKWVSGEGIISILQINNQEVQMPEKARFHWVMRTQDEPFFLLGHRGEITDIVFSKDGKLLATASAEEGDLYCQDCARTVKLWDASTYKLKATVAHPQSVKKLAFSPDGKKMAVASYATPKVTIWDTEQYTQIASLDGITYPVQSLVYTPEGNRLLTAGSGENGMELIAWDVSGIVPEEIHRESWEKRGTCILSQDGSLVGVSEWSGQQTTVRIWKNSPDWKGGEWLPYEVTTATSKLNYQLHDLQSPMAFSPDAQILAFGGWGLVFWNGKETKGVRASSLGKGKSITFSPDGRLIAVANTNTAVGAQIWMATTKIPEYRGGTITVQ